MRVGEGEGEDGNKDQGKTDVEGEDEDDTEDGGENTHETENVDEAEIKGFNYRELKNRQVQLSMGHFFLINFYVAGYSL
jgi:hypothetical protein